MSFLTNLMNASQAVEREKDSPKPANPRAAPKARVISAEARKKMRAGSQSRSAKTQARYAEVFAEPTTVAKASAKLDISHVGCNVQLYRYEERELVRRVENPDSNSRETLWKWVGK